MKLNIFTIAALLGGAYWIYNKNKSSTTVAVSESTGVSPIETKTYDESSLYKAKNYVAMGIRG